MRVIYKAEKETGKTLNGMRICKLGLCILLICSLCGCSYIPGLNSEPKPFYELCGKDTVKWAKNFDASASTLKIFSETNEGANDPVKINDKMKLADIKDALDIIEPEAEVKADNTKTRYIFIFTNSNGEKDSLLKLGSSGKKITFTFREDGVAIIGDVSYKVKNAGSLIKLCGLDTDENSADKAAVDDKKAADEGKGKDDSSAKDDGKKSSKDEKKSKDKKDKKDKDKEKDDNKNKDDDTDDIDDDSDDDVNINEELCEYYDDYLKSIINITTDIKLLKYSKGFVEDVDDDGLDEMGVIYSADGETINTAFGWADPVTKEYFIGGIETGVVEDFPNVSVRYTVIDNVPSFTVWIDVLEGTDGYGDLLVIPITGSQLRVSRQYSYDIRDGVARYTLNGTEIDKADFDSVSAQGELLAVYASNENTKGTSIKKMIPTYR